MPKGSFGGFKSSSPRSSSKSYSYSSPKSPVPTPSYSSASPSSVSAIQHNVKVEQPGFFSNVLQGFGLGAGQSMAFNLFRSSPSVTPTSATSATTPSVTTEQFPKEYIQCMKEYNNNSDTCKQYLEKS